MSIVIRAAAAQDFERIAEIFDHPEVNEQSGLQPHLGMERVTKLLQGYGDNLVLLVAVVDDRVEGYVSLFLSSKPRQKHVASLGMAVHPDSHGKGIGSRLLREAIDMSDNWLNIVRLELDVYTDNEVGIGLYTKLGFEIEGESKMAAFKQGRYIGLYKMARISPNLVKNGG